MEERIEGLLRGSQFKKLRECELSEIREHYELKRIEIATVLARGTVMSVFDEPEAGIDLWSFQNLIRVFERMRETTNGSILIISHQERILDIADEIVVLADGEVAKQGPKSEILPELLGTTAVANACTKIIEGGM